MQTFKFFLLLLLAVSFGAAAQNVGIGILTPEAGLHVVTDNGIIAKGTYNAGGAINETGAAARLIWIKYFANFLHMGNIANKLLNLGYKLACLLHIALKYFGRGLDLMNL